MGKKAYARYSSQVRDAIASSREPNLFPELNIPPSTAYYWIKNPRREIVNPKSNQNDQVEDGQRIKRFLQLILKVLPDEIEPSHLTLDEKHQVLSELNHHKQLWAGVIPISLRAKIVNKLKNCEATADGLCHRRFPGRLSRHEVGMMRSYVESERYAHLSIASLAILARRQNDVICNPKTWYKYIKRLNWRRPLKVHRKEPRRCGLRAKRPHQYWHVDASVIKIPEGSKFYLQVVLDNFSRYVLAWNVATKISGRKTAQLIAEAKKLLPKGSQDSSCNLISDGGPENNNAVVRSEKVLKHQFLLGRVFKNQEELDYLIARFIKDHNTFIPYAHLDGRTPEEAMNGLAAPEPMVAKFEVLSERKKSFVCRYCRR